MTWAFPTLPFGMTTTSLTRTSSATSSSRLSPTRTPVNALPNRNFTAVPSASTTLTGVVLAAAPCGEGACASERRANPAIRSVTRIFVLVMAFSAGQELTLAHIYCFNKLADAIVTGVMACG